MTKTKNAINADVLFDNNQIMDALDQLADTIAKLSKNDVDIYIIGILRGGVDVAKAITKRLRKNNKIVHLGSLDINFYRDDLRTIGHHPTVRRSDLPFDVDGKSIWLIDDVLFTGRTVRAALGEIFDYGRPDLVRLAVLVDRGGQQLPITANIAILQTLMTDNNIHIKLEFDNDDQQQWRICKYQQHH
ncbi:MAG: bifunctional pyr operon transcriptional regulator/uracil phosphoribosyltransferase PyrR [Mariprofundales bacterium]